MAAPKPTAGATPIKKAQPTAEPEQAPAARFDDLTARVASGIPGFDELCEGGFERSSSVLVLGQAGSGKTTFMTQFLYSGAKDYDESGVLISFEEPKDSIVRHSKNFGWDLAALEEAGKMVIINYKPHEVKHLAEEGGGQIWDVINEIGAKRIAIDSLSSYVALFDSMYKVREAQLGLFELVRKWNCTTMFSGESVKSYQARTKSGMEYLTDAVIMLHHPRQRNVRIRAIEITKMRGTNHSQKICPFEFITGEGVYVYPGEDIFEEFGKE